MITADEARKKSDLKRRQDDEAREGRIKKHKKAVRSRVPSLIKKLRPEVLRVIEMSANDGDKSCTVGHYQYPAGYYSSSEHALIAEATTIAYRCLAKELRDKPFCYHVAETSETNDNVDYQNEIYTLYKWEISW